MTAAFPIVIHHNPACGTPRRTLERIRATGHDPVVIEYLCTGWTLPQLLALFAAANLTPREALRTGHELVETLRLNDDGASDDAILTAMLGHPVLVNRPIVVSPKGVRLCRPAEVVDCLI